MKISLIGMPGVGKSVIGATLGELHTIPFIDTDLLIEERLGKTVLQIIEELGNDAFLQEEEQTLLSVSFGEKLILATGGSAVMSESGMAHLAEQSTIVYLHAPLEMLKQRVAANGKDIKGAKQRTFESLYKEREARYTKVAEYTVEVGGRSIFDITQEIVQKVQPDALVSEGDTPN